MEITSRVFQDYPGAAYVLPADQEERERLRSQHNLIRDAFDGKLVADSIKLKPGQSVLDSGTGTGAWLMDLVSESPDSVAFYGIDISSRLFPQSPPHNVTFSTLSILTLPPDWTEKFDLIHQRLLILALRTPDWHQAISEIFRALKPGGSVQIIEPLHHPVSESEAGHQVAGPASDRLWGILRELGAKRGFVWDCVYKLEGWLKDAGFVDISVEQGFTPFGRASGEKAAATLKVSRQLHLACKPSVLKTEGLSWKGTGEDFDALLSDAEIEWNETPGCGSTWVRFSARKSLQA